MKILYLVPYWGSERLSAETFLSRAKRSGFDGVELSLPADPTQREQWSALLRQFKLSFVIEQCESADEGTADYVGKFESALRHAVAMRPLFVNSHTGKDHFTFEENSRLLRLAALIEQQSGVSTKHETHRGRAASQDLL